MQRICIFVTALCVTGCGGGGGSAPLPLVVDSPPTFSYDRIDQNYDSKVWDTLAVGSIYRASEGLLDFSLPTSSVTFEGANYSLEIQGSTLTNDTAFTYNLDFNNFNTTTSPLYDVVTGELAAGLVVQSQSNASIVGAFYEPAYMGTKNIEYSGIAMAEIAFSNNDLDTFWIAFGDQTEAGDMPSSGTKTFEIDSWLTGHFTDESGYQRVVATGDAEVTVDFAQNTVNGSIVLKEFYDFEAFVEGGVNNSQIVGAPYITAEFQDGELSGSQLNASIVITDSPAGFLGSGQIVAGLFGANANELAGSFFGAKDEADSSGFTWDVSGAFFGASD